MDFLGDGFDKDSRKTRRVGYINRAFSDTFKGGLPARTIFVCAILGFLKMILGPF